MHPLKRILALMLVALICLAGVQTVPVAAAEVILDPKQASGSSYTPSDRLAAALDRVFAGDVDLFTDVECTREVSFPLGTSLSNSTQYYMKSQTTGTKISGWQCYIYANAVYNQLFREWVGHANGFAHSQLLINGGSTLTYEMLSQAGVRCGAYLRTTANADGSFSGDTGHSMILLAYDSTSITYLEGNADGNGLVRITSRTWSDFNQRQLSGRGRYIAHIVQPKAEVYDQWYSVCTHSQYDTEGKCTKCGQSFDWQSSFYAGAAGRYRVTTEATPRTEAPYESAASGKKLTSGTMVEVTGTCQNAFGQLWYVTADGTYIPSGCLQLVEMTLLEITCRNFSPVDGILLEQKSQPVKGIITSSQPIKAISGYLDGIQYAVWTAGDQQTMTVDLQTTDLNKKLSFSTLSKGQHTIRLELTSYNYEDPLVIHDSLFYMVEYAACAHSYVEAVDRNPGCTMEGVREYTCALCGDSYQEALPAKGHHFENGICTVCGAAQLATLSGFVNSFGADGVPIAVALRRGDETVMEAVVQASGKSYQFRDLEAGDYTLEVRQEGCAPRTYTLSLDGGQVMHSAQLLPYGDLSGDGKVNIADTARLYSHVRGTDIITQPYALSCGDLTGDGVVNVGDVGRLYANIKE